MESIFGNLIQFESEEEYFQFIENIDKESSIQFLEKALEYSQKMGVFDFQEAFGIFTCLKKIKEK